MKKNTQAAKCKYGQINLNSLKFKHSRFNFIQSIYGGLSEDASLEAVNQTQLKIKEVFKCIELESKEDDTFCDSKAVEICCDKAANLEELLIFIFEVASASSCPIHSFLQIMRESDNYKPEDDLDD